MKMNLGISNGKIWSIVLLLAIIVISLILSHVPFLVNNHYAYEGMTDVSGSNPSIDASPTKDVSVAPATEATAEPSILDKIKSWLGIGASGSASGNVGAGAKVSVSGVDASAVVGGQTKGAATVGPLTGTLGASGSLSAGGAVDGSGNTALPHSSTDSVMPATPALLKGKQENFQALK
jgi:hypothetical protein